MIDQGAVDDIAAMIEAKGLEDYIVEGYYYEERAYLGETLFSLMDMYQRLNGFIRTELQEGGVEL